MPNDYKSGVRKAMEKYHQKQMPSTKPKRKNERPEKEVEKAVLRHLRANGYFVEVVESKAVFSQSAGRFLQGQARAGFVDVVGCNPQGQFVALELKAQGRLSSLRPEQREFLVNAISRGGFGCAVDSVERLEMVLQSYKSNPRPETLMDLLPKKRVDKDLADLFVDVDV